jgi:putative CocE/NonD family hydrolase
VGDLQLGPDALLDTDALLLRWLDHWLKDAGTFAGEPCVRHFALGANRWFEAEKASGDHEVAMYLRSGGRAESRKGDGCLSTDAPQNEPPDIFVYDPEVPVAAPGGAVDQSAIELGNHLLVYTGAPLLAPLHIFGSPRVVIYAATSATHADITAKLVRVLPNGRAEFCCIGIARSTYLFGTDYKEDTVHRWEFTLEPTSYVFAAGDRVRLEIAGCAFPLYDRNPSNATRPSHMSQWNWVRSTHMVFHDDARASALYLPDLPVVGQ